MGNKPNGENSKGRQVLKGQGPGERASLWQTLVVEVGEGLVVRGKNPWSCNLLGLLLPLGKL
jgi:hypothetical protein